MARKPPIKIGVWQGGGPDPGYGWTVGILQLAFDEAMNAVTEAGYRHLEHQFKDLAGHSDPTHSETVDVRPIEDFHELRDKGAPLGGANIRVFFGVDPDRRALIVTRSDQEAEQRPNAVGRQGADAGTLAELPARRLRESSPISIRRQLSPAASRQRDWKELQR